MVAVMVVAVVLTWQGDRGGVRLRAAERRGDRGAGEDASRDHPPRTNAGWLKDSDLDASTEAVPDGPGVDT